MSSFVLLLHHKAVIILCFFLEHFSTFSLLFKYILCSFFIEWRNKKRSVCVYVFFTHYFHHFKQNTVLSTRCGIILRGPKIKDFHA